jgi:8-oxo-dGTP pyrophosphatase MutT (NUDIX family)
VLFVDGRLAVIKRWRPDAGDYAVLPGGSVEDGETPEVAAVREAMEELGVEVRVVETLEVEVHNEQPHTFLRCELVGGTFGTGTGDEYTAERQATRGTYEPALIDVDELAAIGLRPAWLAERVPGWLS